MHRLPLEERLQAALQKRSNGATYRKLRAQAPLVDLTSNDYLGLAKSSALKQRFRSLLDELDLDLGSTGSRLLSGNSALFDQLESRLAQFHNSEAGLIFNSGFDANMAIFQALPRRGDTILYDQKIHASVKVGARLSLAPSFSFLHNDLEDLERRLKRASGDIFVATEALFSMDGDFAPLEEMLALCNRYGACLIVDEAHSTGIFGARGEGRVVELGLEEQVPIRLHTFGKALGSHGAFVACSNTIKNYLVNFGYSFIYTTALPPHSLLGIKVSLEALENSSAEREELHLRINDFARLVSKYELPLSPRPGPIQILETGSAQSAKELERRLSQSGYGIRAIVAPTVALGGERLRIVLHSFNTEQELSGFASTLRKYLIELEK